MPVFTSGGGSSAPKVEQATPSITVSSGGLITATSNQQEGLVPAGTKTATHQLTTQTGTTITPGTSQKTACASGRYTTGNILVAGDADLKAENIKSGVNIFGVTGTLKTQEVISGTISSGYYGYASVSYFDAETEKIVNNKEVSRDITISIYKNSMIAYMGLSENPRITGGQLIESGRVYFGEAYLSVILLTSDNFSIGGGY